MTSRELMQQIKMIRINKNVSQKKLADMIGVTRVSIGNWENGLTFPSLETFTEICYALGVEIKIKEQKNG